ncbi:unnamed protein product [Vitrella brassicaformis CCMP3155]|uniref:Transmembrane protein n=1 Tax=Vitrella brassicaformis (strain CCMP3155) TaxID=1169540 RepID=A0A0G4GEK8_VITBC|nr:unnamed protein product [Vitrella brassicaformis CCMP3155]|eukprot:CEM27819.1 unnamed protein product [Vitrella brassicaformis CCMP3155]
MNHAESTEWRESSRLTVGRCTCQFVAYHRFLGRILLTTLQLTAAALIVGIFLTVVIIAFASGAIPLISQPPTELLLYNCAVLCLEVNLAPQHAEAYGRRSLIWHAVGAIGVNWGMQIALYSVVPCVPGGSVKSCSFPFTNWIAVLSQLAGSVVFWMTIVREPKSWGGRLVKAIVSGVLVQVFIYTLMSVNVGVLLLARESNTLLAEVIITGGYPLLKMVIRELLLVLAIRAWTKEGRASHEVEQQLLPNNVRSSEAALGIPGKFLIYLASSRQVLLIAVFLQALAEFGARAVLALWGRVYYSAQGKKMKTAVAETATQIKARVSVLVPRLSTSSLSLSLSTSDDTMLHRSSPPPPTLPARPSSGHVEHLSPSPHPSLYILPSQNDADNDQDASAAQEPSENGDEGALVVVRSAPPSVSRSPPQGLSPLWPAPLAHQPSMARSISTERMLERWRSRSMSLDSVTLRASSRVSRVDSRAGTQGIPVVDGPWLEMDGSAKSRRPSSRRSGASAAEDSGGLGDPSQRPEVSSDEKRADDASQARGEEEEDGVSARDGEKLAVSVQERATSPEGQTAIMGLENHNSGVARSRTFVLLQSDRGAFIHRREITAANLILADLLINVIAIVALSYSLVLGSLVTLTSGSPADSSTEDVSMTSPQEDADRKWGVISGGELAVRATIILCVEYVTDIVAFVAEDWAYGIEAWRKRIQLSFSEHVTFGFTSLAACAYLALALVVET